MIGQNQINPYKLRMPAEWDRHDACWMLWPHRRDNWKNEAVPAQNAFLQVAQAISQFENLNMGVPKEYFEQAKKLIESKGLKGIYLYCIESNDCWMRDIGPTFVLNEGEEKGKVTLKAVDWGFNGYGGKFPPWELDEKVANSVASIVLVESLKADFVLEGGSIHVDGEGTLLTTEQCLLHPSRNPDLNKEEIEKRLKFYLGIQKVIWLKRGLIADEDTDGHIDNICCFSKPGEVLLSWTDDEADEQYEISREALNILENETDAKGRIIKIVKIPIPPKMFYTKEDCDNLTPFSDGSYSRQAGVRMAASYANFYIANGGIVCPSFDTHTDEIARDILQKVFPDRTVVQVPSRDILLGGGNIHCITQQQPSI